MTPAVAGRPGAIGDASVMEAGAVAAVLDVDVETGLSAQEAASRLAQNGPQNCMRRRGHRPGGVCWRSSRTR